MIIEESIIGACNPALASQALEAEPLIGVLLPCNVIVRESEDKLHVNATDPGLMASMIESGQLDEVAGQARNLINSALRTIAG